MTEAIRLEQEQTDEEVREWKREIQETEDRIKKLNQPPPPPNHPQPGQPAY